MSAVGPDHGQGWSAQLDALRRSGADRADPVRFRHLQTLTGRLAGQTDAVRRVLEGKLQAALDAYLARVAASPSVRATPRRADDASPLVQLNRTLRARLPSAGTATGGVAPIRVQGELASVDRFRRAWSSHRALVQVEQAAARSPANAGPLNSHALVLQSLALMQELSPAYLARFMAHVESLQWLEQAGTSRAPSGAAKKVAKPARRTRTTKG